MAGELIGYKLKDERGSFTDPRARTIDGKKVSIHGKQVILLSDLPNGRVLKRSFMETCIRGGGLVPVYSEKGHKAETVKADHEPVVVEKEMPKGAVEGPPAETKLSAQELALKPKGELIALASKYYVPEDLQDLNKAELVEAILAVQKDKPKKARKSKKASKEE